MSKFKKEGRVVKTRPFALAAVTGILVGFVGLGVLILVLGTILRIVLRIVLRVVLVLGTVLRVVLILILHFGFLQ